MLRGLIRQESQRLLPPVLADALRAKAEQVAA
jgi:hypothetical protein